MTHLKIVNRQTGQKNDFIESFKELPIVLNVCNKTGISRSTFYRWIKEDLDFERRFKEVESAGRDHLNDIAEMSLVQLIKEKNLKAIMFYLIHNHPRYSERSISLKESDINNISSGIKNMGNNIEQDKSFFGSLFINKVPGKIIRTIQRFYLQVVKRKEDEEEIKKLGFIYKLKGIKDEI